MSTNKDNVAGGTRPVAPYVANNTMQHAGPSSLPPNPDNRTYAETYLEVWDHFTKVEGGDHQNVRAVCNYCKASYMCDSEHHGTLNMKMHIIIQCQKYPYRVEDPKELMLSPQNESEEGSEKSLSSSDSTASSGFNAERCRKLLARLIIIEELPFSFVEKDGFRGLCAAAEPNFSVPTRHEVAKDCFRLYFDEKTKLKNLLKKACERVCLTTNVWASVQDLNYVVITAHFIDNEWNLQKKILNVCQIPNQEGVTIGEEVEKCLLEWGIERVFTITTDNASYNDEAISYLVKKIKNWNGQVLEDEFIHVTCFSHILNLIVSDGLRELCDSIGKIRNAVRCVRFSPEHLLQFKRCAKEEKISSKSLVYLDFPTMWNSTYHMLEAALKFQKAFDRLEKEDAEYASELNEDERIKGPSFEDWENARVFVKFLKIFYEVTLKISGSLFITSNKFFQEIVLLQELIQKYSSSDDPFLSSMAQSMKAKYDKYWGNTNKTNYLLYVAIVLDPRFKRGLVKYSFDFLYGSEVGGEMTKMVDSILRRLYDEYKNNLSDAHNDDVALSPLHMDAESTDPITKRFRRHLDEVNNMEYKTEVDRYLAESLEKADDAFDVLGWWKVNSSKYKILGRVAKDVLAIPMSTMASRSTFHIDGHVVDSYRCSLNPKTMEALICAQNWLQPSPTYFDLRKKLEALENASCAADEALYYDDYSPDSN